MPSKRNFEFKFVQPESQPFSTIFDHELQHLEMDYNSFLQLLGSMTSSDNEERKNAEEIFGNLVQSNGILVIQLLFTVFQQNQANINLIIFTLILLTNIYKRFPSVFQTDNDSIVQSFLLNLLDNPLNNTIFQSTSSTLIAAAAKFYVPNQRWPTFPSDLIQRYASDNISTILISLDCLIICIHAHLFDFPTLVPVVDSLFQKFWESPPSQIHLHLITLIFIMFQNQAVCQCFEPFVVSFPQLLFRLDSIKLANLLVSELTNYANSIIPIFQSHFTSFFECLIQILSDTGRDSGQRKLCLELLCEISESNPCEMSPTIEILYTTLMNLICEISGPDFLNEDYEDPTPRTAAENSLFRFSSSFYKFSLEQNSDCFPKLLLSIFDQFNQCTGSFEKYRAGYVLLRETFDILVPSFVNGELVENLVRKIIEGLQCHNVFCEIAIFQVLTQAALQLSIRDFEKDYNSILIPAIIGYVTSNIGNSRYALESLSCLISNSKDEDIDGIFDQLFTFITQIFEGIPLQAKLYALKCITSLIQKSKNRITSFYPIVLTILVEVIKSNELSLQIQSIMAFSMIGFVLPQCDDASTELMDKFAKDSQGFIQLIMSINRSTLTGEQDDTLNQALQLLVWTLGPHYPDAFSTLLASQLEIAAQDINMKTVPLSSDRSDFEGDIMLPNKTENMLYIYNKAQIDVVEHTLAIISSFLLKIGGHSLSLFPQLIEVFSKTISYFFYSVLQDETLQCLYGLVTTMYENKCESYNDLALVINSFNSVCDNLYEGEDTVSSFIDFAITLAYCSPNLELGLAQTFLVLVEKCIQSFSDDSSQIHTSCALLLKAITKSSNV